MFTKCPHCATTFSVTDEHLAIANGTVRCGVCHELFNAKDYFFAHPYDSAANSQDKHSNILAESQNASTIPGQATGKTDALPDILINPSGSHHAKPFPRIIFAALSLLAGMVMCLQLLAFYNDRWIPGFLHRASCQWLVCAQPQSARDMSAIEVLNRSVFSHPSESDALMVTATFINRSQHNLPLPEVELLLLDIDGNPVAARRFKANEYLTANHRSKQIMRTHEVIAFQVEIQDPGEKVIGYTFNFL